MATLTFTNQTVQHLSTSDARIQSRPTFFGRVLQAMIESRQRKAEIEIRRSQAVVGDRKQNLDYFLLPFSGE
jgi:hypothetical protein